MLLFYSDAGEEIIRYRVSVNGEPLVFVEEDLEKRKIRGDLDP
jgi:hypothetical protein